MECSFTETVSEFHRLPKTENPRISWIKPSGSALILVTLYIDKSNWIPSLQMAYLLLLFPAFCFFRWGEFHWGFVALCQVQNLLLALSGVTVPTTPEGISLSKSESYSTWFWCNLTNSRTAKSFKSKEPNMDKHPGENILPSYMLRYEGFTVIYWCLSILCVWSEYTY